MLPPYSALDHERVELGAEASGRVSVGDNYAVSANSSDSAGIPNSTARNRRQFHAPTRPPGELAQPVEHGLYPLDARFNSARARRGLIGEEGSSSAPAAYSSIASTCPSGAALSAERVMFSGLTGWAYKVLSCCAAAVHSPAADSSPPRPRRSRGRRSRYRPSPRPCG